MTFREWVRVTGIAALIGFLAIVLSVYGGGSIGP